MMRPVLAIELHATPLRSTPQPHLLHRPDDDDGDSDHGIGDFGDDDNDQV